MKFYPADASRFQTEVDALLFLRSARIGRVPLLVSQDPIAQAALLSWIGGEPAKPARDGDIAEMVAFIEALKSAAAQPASHALSLATEACLSGEQIGRQLDARIRRLNEVRDEPALTRFLASAVAPEIPRAVARAETASGSAWRQDLPQRYRTLSPSDFGVHNALRDADGHLHFLDFEYFGWDDPVKLVADGWWHPGMALNETQRRLWLGSCVPVFAMDPGMDVRLRAFLPLYGLRWICIVLNEFLPERWARRRAASQQEDWAQAKTRQLAKAEDLLHRLLASNALP